MHVTSFAESMYCCITLISIVMQAEEINICGTNTTAEK